MPQYPVFRDGDFSVLCLCFALSEVDPVWITQITAEAPRIEEHSLKKILIDLVFVKPRVLKLERFAFCTEGFEFPRNDLATCQVGQGIAFGLVF